MCRPHRCGDGHARFPLFHRASAEIGEKNSVSTRVEGDYCGVRQFFPETWIAILELVNGAQPQTQKADLVSPLYSKAFADVQKLGVM